MELCKYFVLYVHVFFVIVLSCILMLFGLLTLTKLLQKEEGCNVCVSFESSVLLMMRERYALVAERGVNSCSSPTAVPLVHVHCHTRCQFSSPAVHLPATEMAVVYGHDTVDGPARPNNAMQIRHIYQCR